MLLSEHQYLGFNFVYVKYNKEDDTIVIYYSNINFCILLRNINFFVINL